MVGARGLARVCCMRRQRHRPRRLGQDAFQSEAGSGSAQSRSPKLHRVTRTAFTTCIVFDGRSTTMPAAIGHRGCAACARLRCRHHLRHRWCLGRRRIRLDDESQFRRRSARFELEEGLKDSDIGGSLSAPRLEGGASLRFLEGSPITSQCFEATPPFNEGPCTHDSASRFEVP